MEPQALFIWGLIAWLAMSSHECNAAAYKRQSLLQNGGESEHLIETTGSGLQDTTSTMTDSGKNEQVEVFTKVINAETPDVDKDMTKEKPLIQTSENISTPSGVASTSKEFPASDEKTESRPISQSSVTEFTEDGVEEEDENGVIRGKYFYMEEDGEPAQIEYEAIPGVKFEVKNYLKGLKVLPFPGFSEAPESGRALSGMPTNQENPTNSKTFELNDGNVKSSSAISTEREPEYEHASVIARYNLKTLSRKTRSANFQEQAQDLVGKEEIKTNDNSQSTQVENIESPVDASYKFGFSADGQTRDEEADADGNVQGSYSYIGEDGILTKVEYEAGSGKGFIVKKIVQENTRRSLESPQSQSTLNSDQSSEKIHSTINVSPAIPSDQKILSEDHKIQTPRKKVPVVVNKSQNDEEEETESEAKINQNNDRSYSFSYVTPDHWREESVASSGNVKTKFSVFAHENNKKSQPHYKGVLNKHFNLPSIQTQQAPVLVAVPAVTNLNTNNFKMDTDGSYSFSYLTPNQYRAEVANIYKHDSSLPKEMVIKQQEKEETSEGQDLSTSQILQDSTVNVNNASPPQNDGSYSYSFEIPDQTRQESGDAEGNVQGQYSFLADDGVMRTVNYKASPETGFTAKGSHLPSSENVNAESGSSNAEDVKNIQDSTVNKHSVSPTQNDRSYSYSFEIPDQMSHESGDADGNVQGQYSFMADDNIVRTVNYKASPETGFTAEGSHLPSSENINEESGASNAEKVKNIQDSTVNSVSPTRNDGSYSYSFEIPNQMRHESGNTDGDVQGQYSFMADDGIMRTVNYKASSETGFTAEGSHLPSSENVNKQSESGASIADEVKASTAPIITSAETMAASVVLNSENPSRVKNIMQSLNVDANQVKADSNMENVLHEGINSYPTDDLSLTPAAGFIGISPDNTPQVLLDLSEIRRATAIKDNGNIHMYKKVIKKRPIEPVTQTSLDTLPDGSYSFVYGNEDQIRKESVDTKGNVYSGYQYKTKGGGRTSVVFIRKSVKTGDNDDLRKDGIVLQKQAKRNIPLNYLNRATSSQNNNQQSSGRRNGFSRKRHVQGLAGRRNGFSRKRHVQGLAESPAKLQDSQVFSDMTPPPENSNIFQAKPTIVTAKQYIETENQRAKSIISPFRGNVKYRRQLV